mmetsp:Transcript_8439/g.14904  ORF Transcript_8439/g.14904 Transcript_8439/m.14904 type:complete len:98 (+) Transcript_8439:1669-1962(+)
MVQMHCLVSSSYSDIKNQTASPENSKASRQILSSIVDAYICLNSSKKMKKIIVQIRYTQQRQYLANEGNTTTAILMIEIISKSCFLLVSYPSLQHQN